MMFVANAIPTWILNEIESVSETHNQVESEYSCWKSDYIENFESMNRDQLLLEVDKFFLFLEKQNKLINEYEILKNNLLDQLAKNVTKNKSNTNSDNFINNSSNSRKYNSFTHTSTTRSLLTANTFSDKAIFSSKQNLDINENKEKSQCDNYYTLSKQESNGYIFVNDCRTAIKDEIDLNNLNIKITEDDDINTDLIPHVSNSPINKSIPEICSQISFNSNAFDLNIKDNFDADVNFPTISNKLQHKIKKTPLKNMQEFLNNKNSSRNVVKVKNEVRSISKDNALKRSISKDNKEIRSIIKDNTLKRSNSKDNTLSRSINKDNKISSTISKDNIDINNSTSTTITKLNKPHHAKSKSLIDNDNVKLNSNYLPDNKISVERKSIDNLSNVDISNKTILDTSVNSDCNLNKSVNLGNSVKSMTISAKSKVNKKAKETVKDFISDPKNKYRDKLLEKYHKVLEDFNKKADKNSDKVREKVRDNVRGKSTDKTRNKSEDKIKFSTIEKKSTINNPNIRVNLNKYINASDKKK